MTDRERLVALLRSGTRPRTDDNDADAILAACEVRWKEPETDPRDLEAAIGACQRFTQFAGFNAKAWDQLSKHEQGWLISESRRARLAQDRVWNEAIEAADATLDGWLIREGSMRVNIRALKRHASGG